MNVLVAPCAYKGSLSPKELALAITNGLRAAGFGEGDDAFVIAPLADGGDGTVEAINMACGGTVEQLEVTGALDERQTCAWLRLGDTAIVELASACGIGVLDNKFLRPLAAHTFGLGEVIKHCLQQGFKDIVVCIGGSASTDGGTGALAALGAKFFDEAGKELPLGGGSLADLKECDLEALSQWSQRAKFRVAVDVTNPLCGPQGAAHIFGPQKGADGEQVESLDRALTNLADVMEAKAGKRLRDLPGAGAAGGTAFGLACGLDAEIISGFNYIADLMELDDKIILCDVIISAEGKLDETSLHGKAIGELAKKCKQHQRRLMILPARAQKDVNWSQYGITSVFPTAPNNSLPAGKQNVSDTVRTLFTHAR